MQPKNMLYKLEVETSLIWIKDKNTIIKEYRILLKLSTTTSVFKGSSVFKEKIWACSTSIEIIVERFQHQSTCIVIHHHSSHFLDYSLSPSS
ncbi:hypothetical protein YC2023_020392 [Brassica napus]